MNSNAPSARHVCQFARRASSTRISDVMIYLFDTSAISDFMRQHPKLDAKLATLTTQDQLRTCSIVRGEILFGIERMPTGKRRDDLAAQATRAFSSLPCEPVAASAADHYATLKTAQQKLGLPLDENDLWIAACAACIGAVVVTRDSDFRRIPGIQTQDWTE